MLQEQILSYLVAALSPATALILLILQIYTYRQTRHSSVLLLVVSTIIGLACLTVSYWPYVFSVANGTKTVLALSASVLLLSQCILSIVGVAGLFRTFRELIEFRRDAASGAPSRESGSAEVSSYAAAAEPAARSAPVGEGRESFRLVDIPRLWLLQPPRSNLNGAPDLVMAVLACIAVGAWITLEKWSAGPDAMFISWNLPVMGFYLLLAVAAAYLVSRASRPALPLRTTLLIAAAIMPLLVVLTWAIDDRIPAAVRTAATGALLLYLFVYVAISLRRIRGRGTAGALTLWAVLLIGYAVAERHAYWSASVWLTNPNSEEEKLPALANAESLLFDQRDKIDRVVNAMQGSMGDRPVTYYIGFAGVAEQRVFAEEIKLAVRNVSARFDVGNRQLLLINDRRDLDRFPIATTTNLAYAIKSVGARMNRDRDTLFLSLSSHGSRAPALSVSNSTLSLKQLNDKDLTQALDVAGIKRRIIVISACHAGAFIPALKNANSIVITAAAADNTSFGCSDDRDLTYFGEAFYRDALPKAQDLRSAFEEAKREVSRREQQEKQTPSDPQAFFGSDIENWLKEYPIVTPTAVAH